MEINRQLSILAILIAALFLVAESWPSTALAATKTSTETQTKVTKKKAARNTKGTVNRIKPRIAQTQPANVSGNVAPVAYPVCVPCVSGPVYTWNVPATAGTSLTQSAGSTTQQWPSGTYGAAQQGNSQATPVPTTGMTVAAPVCPNVCVPCWNVPTYSWNAPATAAAPPFTQSYGPPIPPPPPAPGTGFSAPAQPASTGRCPFQWLCSVLRNPCP